MAASCWPWAPTQPARAAGHGQRLAGPRDERPGGLELHLGRRQRRPAARGRPGRRWAWGSRRPGRSKVDGDRGRRRRRRWPRWTGWCRPRRGGRWRASTRPGRRRWVGRVAQGDGRRRRRRRPPTTAATTTMVTQRLPWRAAGAAARLGARSCPLTSPCPPGPGVRPNRYRGPRVPGSRPMGGRQLTAARAVRASMRARASGR